MSGVAGRSGPPGNDNGGKAKRWTAAIERALERKGVEGQQELDKLAEEFVDAIRLAGKKGDISGFRELGDRMEGKAQQGVTLSGDTSATVTHRIEQAIVDPRDSASGSQPQGTDR